MDWFSALTGMVTIIAFLMQARGEFAKHKILIGKITLFAFGILLGLVVRYFFPSNVSLARPMTTREVVGILFFGGFGLTAAGLIFTSIYGSDEKRRLEAKGIGSNVCFMFVMLSLWLLPFWFSCDLGQRLTLEECALLGDECTRRNDYSRAVEIYTTARSRHQINDDQYRALSERIRDVTEQQRQFMSIQGAGKPEQKSAE